MATTLRSITVSNTGGFNPKAVQALAGDAVGWFNSDQGIVHQPYPASGKPGDWVPPIPGGNSSEQYNLGVPGSFPYLDATNGSLTGSILVSNFVQIGPIFGGGGVSFVQTFPAAGTSIGPGTTVVWQNSDAAPHWPAPVGGPSNAWLPQAIAPGAYSQPVSFNTVGSFSYADASVAPATSVGTIVVANPVVTVAANKTAPPPATFAPTPVSVTVGFAVTFTNKDTVPHQPAPAGGAANAWFASPIAAGASATSPVFNTVGNINYADALNPTVAGVVQVVGK